MKFKGGKEIKSLVLNSRVFTIFFFKWYYERSVE